ncbi:MAG: hypothetical protein U1E05_20125, partial [Patescibacteria group bacterium]|nr:hypothetical protein [Patescibacteria group bacterium]
MWARRILFLLLGLALTWPVSAQSPAAPAGGGTLNWRPVDAVGVAQRSDVTRTADARVTPPRDGGVNVLAETGARPRVTLAVEPSRSNGTLPNEHGQVWREYDIAPYTVRVTSTQRPEQALVDWILRETGYEAWHGEPLGILSATPRTLRVY